MFNFLLVFTLIFSSCFFGSITDFSDKDIVGKQNSVINSGFEDGDYQYNHMPENWKVLDEPNENVFWDNTNFFNGEKSLKIEHPSSKISIISEAFEIDPEAVYYSRCFIKTNYQSNHSITFRFLAFNAKGKRVDKFSVKNYPKTDWTQVELTSGFFNRNAKFGRIIISFPKRPDKIFWIDDVESYNVYKIQK